MATSRSVVGQNGGIARNLTLERAADLVFRGSDEGDHFSSPVIAKILQDSRNVDFTQLSLDDTITLARRYARNYAMHPHITETVSATFAPFQGKPVAVLYKHREPGGKNPLTFSSPWRAEKVDEVGRLDSAQVNVKTEGAGYLVTVSVPLADLGLPTGAAALKGDFGVIYGDEAGTVNLLRSYWSNQATALVSDIPGEIMLSPNLWGTITF